MDDAFGDPRNYDPNVQGWDPNLQAWGDPAPPPEPDAPRVANTRMVNDPLTPQPVKEPTAIDYAPQGYSPTQAAPTATGGFSYAPPSFHPYQSIEPFVFSGGPFKFDNFSYEGFKPSSLDDAENEPGFKAAQDRLAKEVQNSAAYRGVLRSGATIGQLDSVLDTNRGQNFAQFDARNFRNYQANRSNAFDNWKSNLDAALSAWQGNLGMEEYAYDKKFADNQGLNNYTFNVDNALAQDALARWQTIVNSATSLAKPV